MLNTSSNTNTQQTSASVVSTDSVSINNNNKTRQSNLSIDTTTTYNNNNASTLLTPHRDRSRYVSPQSTSPKNNNDNDFNDNNSHILNPENLKELLNDHVVNNISDNVVNWRSKLVLVLVGLPARGKSYIAYKIVTWLRWRGMKSDLFNVGKLRRQRATTNQDASFFDSSNANAKQQREQLAMASLDMLLDWLENGGDVAVFDATNTTKSRRLSVRKHCKQRSPLLNVVFVESICDDPKVLEANYIEKASNSPDYKHMPLDEALKDLKLRVQQYEKVYQPIQTDNISYIKLINLSAKIICNKVFGSLAHGISSYLMSIHVQPRPIYLVRCGHSAGADENSSIDPNDLTNIDLQRSQSQSEPHIPYTLPLDAKLDGQGKAFAYLLKEFLIKKCNTYWNEHDELWNYINDYLQITFDDSDNGNDYNDNDKNNNIDDNNATRVQDDDRSVSSPAQFNQNNNNNSTDNISDTPSNDQQQQHRRRSSTNASASVRPPLTPRSKLPLTIYTSTAPRSIETAAPVSNYAQYTEQHSCLNMLDMGEYHGHTTDDIKQYSPRIIEEWSRDRFHYRWPGGESQRDKARSLSPLILEIERQRFPVLVVSHASTLQVLYGYFLGLQYNCNDYYALNIPQDVVIELIPSQYGWIERRYDFKQDVQKSIKKQQQRRSIQMQQLSRQNSDASTPETLSRPIGERTLGIQHYQE